MIDLSVFSNKDTTITESNHDLSSDNVRETAFPSDNQQVDICDVSLDLHVNSKSR